MRVENFNLLIDSEVYIACNGRAYQPESLEDNEIADLEVVGIGTIRFGLSAYVVLEVKCDKDKWESLEEGYFGGWSEGHDY